MATDTLIQSQQLLQRAAAAARSERAAERLYQVVAAFISGAEIKVKGFRSPDEAEAFFAARKMDPSDYVTVNRFKEHVVWMS